jgi:twinkle protein
VEGKGTHSGNEPDLWENASLEESFVLASSKLSDHCIRHISDLPRSLRFEIDKGYSTGFSNLDNYLKGLRKGEVTVITADTGCGKTTFCTQIMVQCAMQNIPVWINSWEMRPEVILRKLASLVLRRPMKICAFTEHENEQFDEWCNRYKVYINEDTTGMDIDGLSKKLKAAKAMGVEIVMLDHLDYLVNFRREKLHEAIDETVKRLHELAFSLEMHFFLICHPRQSSTGNEEVGIHSLKGSSSIKQYADNVLILHRTSRTDPTSHAGKMKVRIAKNRMFGTEGVCFLFYQPEWDGYIEFIEPKGN